MTNIELNTEATQKRFAAWLDNRVNSVKIKMRCDWYMRNVLAEVAETYRKQTKGLNVKKENS